MSPFVCSKLCSINQSTTQMGAFILAALVIIIAVSVTLVKSKTTRKLKLPSSTSSFIIKQFKTQNPKEEPFMALVLPYHDEHKDLNNVGGWAKHDVLLEMPNEWENTTFAPMEDPHPYLEIPLRNVQH